MKQMLLTIVILTGSAFGAPSKTILSKTSGGGFTLPELAGYERCDLFPSHVAITHQFGMHTPTAVKVTEVRKVALAGDIKLLMEKAKLEEVVEKPNDLCDGPSTSISANPTDGATSLLLFTTGGCGSPRKERQGVFSTKLRNIIDLYCPKTFDFAANE